MTESSDDALNNVLNRVDPLMQATGFKRKGMTYRFEQGSQCGIVQFQRSRSQPPRGTEFTINVGIVVKELLFDWQDYAKVDAFDGQLQTRIGNLLPDCRRDKWWTVQAENAVATADEIENVVRSFAIPYVMKFLHLETLLEHISSGASGLPDKARDRYVEGLRTLIASSQGR